jgi:hypothetical protein
MSEATGQAAANPRPVRYAREGDALIGERILPVGKTAQFPDAAWWEGG